MEFQIEPWDKWPRKETPGYNRKNPFKAGYQDTIIKLEYELDHLKVKHCVIRVNVKRGDIRLDGQLRQNATTTHPGVILYFMRKGVYPMEMACDACTHWQANLRAIALTLSRLRMAEIYGVTSSGEQYKGWEQLPPPSRNSSAEMTEDMAWDVLAKWSGIPINLMKENAHVKAAAVKTAKMKTHPDKGGDQEEFKKIQKADELLNK